MQRPTQANDTRAVTRGGMGRLCTMSPLHSPPYPGGLNREKEMSEMQTPHGQERTPATRSTNINRS